MNISLAENTLPTSEKAVVGASPSESSTWRDYFSRGEWLIYATIVLAGLLLRWIGLGDRPYHHDESLHGMYGRYFYDFPDQNYYRYDPMLHGPFLYNLLRIVYSSFGYSDFGARVPIAILGSLFILLPFLFRQYMSRRSLLVLTGAIALSPTLIYWSRFLREDFGVLSTLFLIYFGATVAAPRLKSLCVLVGLFLMFSMKANFYVFLALIAGFFVYEALFNFFREGELASRIRSSYRSFRAGKDQGPIAWPPLSIGETFFLSALGVAVVVLGLSTLRFLDRSTALWSVLAVAAVPVAYHLGKFFVERFVLEIRDRPRWPFILTACFIAINIGALWLSYDSASGAASVSAPGYYITAYVIVVLLLAFYFLWEYLKYLAPLLPAGTLRGMVLHLVQEWRYVSVALVIGAFASIYLYSAGFRHDVFQLVQNQNAGTCPYLPAGGGEDLWSTIVCATLGYKPPSILYGFYYWMHHHSIERIQGPFLHHFYVLSWYETIFIVAYLAHLWSFYRTASRGVQIGGVLIVALTFLSIFFAFTHNFGDSSAKGIWAFFKLKDHLDAAALPLLLLHPVLLTTEHLRKGERGLAFLGYFFTANFFTYSYLGEKVPWLSMYILVPGLVYLVLYFENYLRQHPLRSPTVDWATILERTGFVLILLGIIFILQEPTPALSRTQPTSPEQAYNLTFIGFGIGLYLLSLVSSYTAWLGRVRIAALLLTVAILWNLRAALLTNFVYAGEAREYISQVHTTPEFRDLMWQLRAENASQIRGYKPTILISGDAVWPSTWYLRDIPEYKFSAPANERSNFKYIIQDWKDPAENVPEGFIATRLNLRGWWVPDLKQITLKKFLNYALNKTPWNQPGYSYVTLLVNEKKG
jgi:predicted membrane-bound mannosyltransferase